MKMPCVLVAHNGDEGTGLYSSSTLLPQGCKQVVKNVARILQLCGSSKVPYHEGRDTPISGTPIPPSSCECSVATTVPRVLEAAGHEHIALSFTVDEETAVSQCISFQVSRMTWAD